jgi:hypothetical protein
LAQDSFTDALGRLDPASRALLDLSLRRGMRPEQIGEMLGSDPASVVVAREQALGQLAAELGLEDPAEIDGVRARLAELPGEAWTPGTKVAEPDPQPEPEPEPERRRSRVPLLLALLAIAAIALVVILASSGDSSSDEAANTTPAPKPPPKPKPAKPKPPPEKAVALTPLGRSSGVKGTAALTNGAKRLHLAITGLRDGSYEVWLYDSVIDARSLGSAHGTKLDLDLKLPRHASHYRFIDVSREPHDGNPNHSGESVLRVPLAKLARELHRG